MQLRRPLLCVAVVACGTHCLLQLALSPNATERTFALAHGSGSASAVASSSFLRAGAPLARRGARSSAVAAVAGGVVAEGIEVALDFAVIRDDTGEVVDSSDDTGPLVFVCGEKEVFPAIDSGVVGMAVGDKKTIPMGTNLFGKGDKGKVMEFPREELPEDAEVGAELELEGPGGPMMATVVKLTDTMATLDMNHPLAGVAVSMTVTVLSTGAPAQMDVETVSPGDGATFPETGDKLTMHYTGTLAANGNQFDSSRDRGQPFQFTIGVGQVIKGWDVGVMKMSLGERAILKIPSSMGYGARGAGEDIPPDADLVFDVELLKINRVR